jgi:hypothetical protein
MIDVDEHMLEVLDAAQPALEPYLVSRSVPNASAALKGQAK